MLSYQRDPSQVAFSLCLCCSHLDGEEVMWEGLSRPFSSQVPQFWLFINKYLLSIYYIPGIVFFFLASLCGIWDLSFLITDWTCTPCTGNLRVPITGLQGSPYLAWFSMLGHSSEQKFLLPGNLHSNKKKKKKKRACAQERESNFVYDVR